MGSTAFGPLLSWLDGNTAGKTYAISDTLHSVRVDKTWYVHVHMSILYTCVIVFMHMQD